MVNNEIQVDNGKEIAMKFDFENIILSTIKGFKKIKSDIESLSERKKGKFYKNYKINLNEKIIAYCKVSPLGMSFWGCIFTDKAFYCNFAEKLYINYQSVTKALRASENEHELIRIEYTELCNYIVCRKTDDNSAGAGLCDREVITNVIGDGIFKNPLADEICVVFINILEKYINVDNIAKKQTDELFKNHYVLAAGEVSTGGLSKGREMVLRAFVKLNEYRKKAIVLLAENEYRKCNLSGYNDFLEEFKKYMTEDFKEELENMTVLFADRLIRELSDLSHEFSEKYLENAFNNLKRIDTSKEMTVILVYICIRLNMHDFARERISVYEQAYGRDKYSEKMEISVCITGHKKMNEVIECLENGNRVPPKYYHLVDSLGFTPLHYAMIMGKTTEMVYMILSNIFLNSVPYILEENINKLFSYIVFGRLTHTNYLSDMNNVMTFHKEYLIPTLPELTEPEIMGLFETNRELYEALDELRAGYDDGLKEVRKATRRSNAEFVMELFSGRNPLRDEFLDKQEEKYRKYHEYAREYEDDYQKSLDEILTEIYKIAEEIDYKLKELHENVRNIMSELKKSDDSLTRFLLNTLASNKEKFVDIHKEIESSDKCRLYNYNGFLIIFPDSAEFEFNAPYRLINIKTGTSIDDEGVQEDLNKKYGNSWFSDEAHLDKDALKTEYRILAKKYHPDIAKESNTKLVFIEIHNEYEEILKRL